jgi:hypothetical protein
MDPEHRTHNPLVLGLNPSGPTNQLIEDALPITYLKVRRSRRESFSSAKYRIASVQFLLATGQIDYGSTVVLQKYDRISEWALQTGRLVSGGIRGGGKRWFAGPGRSSRSGGRRGGRRPWTGLWRCDRGGG